MARPKDNWRHYLHPLQRALAYPATPYSGPCRVTGGPGTGKTVVAVHRAKALADQVAPGELILLTTFDDALSRRLGDLYCQLTGSLRPDIVEVMSVEALARHVMHMAGRPVSGAKTKQQLAEEAVRVALATTPRYRHIVVDEAQDLTAPQWKLLRAVVAPAPDDMFIVGDAHQRIHADRVMLSSHGIHTGGRGGRLVINYRGTHEILQSSLALVSGDQIDDLDGGVETLQECQSVQSGVNPEVRGYSTLDEELSALTGMVVAWRAARIAVRDIAIGVPEVDIPSGCLADHVVTVLRSRGVNAMVVCGDQPVECAVRVVPLRYLKGLEFRCVAIVGLSSDFVPAKDNRWTRDRALAFVACTRARETLSISWNHEPSAILEPLLTHLGSGKINRRSLLDRE